MSDVVWDTNELSNHKNLKSDLKETEKSNYIDKKEQTELNLTESSTSSINPNFNYYAELREQQLRVRDSAKPNNM